MAVQPTDPEVGTTTTGISEAQNARLRKALTAYMSEHNCTVVSLAKAIGIKQPSLSTILNGKGGASHRTARNFAKLLGKSVDDVIGPDDATPGEAISVGPLPDMRIGELLLAFSPLSKPGLYAALTAHPERWSVATVQRAIRATVQSDSTGAPLGGWIVMLDSYEAGAGPLRPPGSVRSGTLRQIEQTRPKPRKGRTP